MIPSLSSYNSLARSSSELEPKKDLGVFALENLLKDSLSEAARGRNILIALIQFKYHRNAHIPLINNTHQQQEKALQSLNTQCRGEEYDLFVSLARNKGTGGLLRDIPRHLRDLLNGLSDEHKAAIAQQLTEDERNFLYQAGVNMPSAVPEKDSVISLGGDIESHPTSGTTSRGWEVRSDRDMLELDRPPLAVKIESDTTSLSSFCEARGKDVLLRRSDKGSSDLVKEVQSQGFKLISKKSDPIRHGTILFFGQFHNVEGLESSPTAQRNVERSQQSILDSLLRLNIKHVFLEGCAYAIYEPRGLEEIREVFRGYKAGDTLTEQQKQMILEVGVSVVYATLNEGVVLHGTTSHEHEFNLNVYWEIHGDRLSAEEDVTKWTVEDREVILYAREKLAMRSMQRFLEDSPQPVALVFGKGHNFSTAFDDEGFLPQFYRKDFTT